MKERELGKYEKALARVLKDKLEEASYVSTMFALIVEQEDSEENCKELYDYVQKNPDADFFEIRGKQNEILGIYIDEDNE